MIIVPGSAPAQPSEQRGQTFTGTVWADPVLPKTGEVAINTVFFTPGARTFWHHHDSGQILQVIAGTGIICAAGDQPRLLRPGDVVWAPPGERHWHGATSESFMTHLAISLGTTVWGGEVEATDHTAANNE